MNARTTDSLLARRALAEKATPGEWITTGINSVHGGYRNRLIYPDEHPDFLIASMNNVANPKCTEDADHIAANSPDVVMADIDEILRLREEVESLRREVENLSGQADRLAGWARMKCDEVQRLESEADWLALVLANAGCGVSLTEYIGEAVNGMSPPAPEHWREAARKAVETSHEN